MSRRHRQRLTGPTNSFPRGKFNNDDEGGLQIAIGVRDHTIIMSFGIDVEWIGFDAASARRLAKMLNERADELDPRA